jgi:hypothetical protein
MSAATQKRNAALSIFLKLAHYLAWTDGKWFYLPSVSRFQEKEKRGEMITKNDNIK